MDMTMKISWDRVLIGAFRTLVLSIHLWNRTPARQKDILLMIISNVLLVIILGGECFSTLGTRKDTK